MTEGKSKLVFVCGSGHSGSTLLSLLLGNQAGMTSLGEIFQTVRDVSRPQKQCTCGQPAHLCPVWSDTLRAASGLPEDERLARTMRMLAHRCGRTIMIDSSKHLKVLQEHAERSDLEVLPVHLVRDGRAVAFSNAKKERDLIQSAIKWQDSNIKIGSYLEKYFAEKHTTILYEDLAVHPVTTVRRLCDFVGIPADMVGLDWKNTTHHQLRGNKMRFAGDAAVRPDAAYIDGLTSQEWEGMTRIIGTALSVYGYAETKSGMRTKLNAKM